MRRVLILGGGGMLGHKLVQVLGARMETWATLRDRSLSGSVTRVLDPARTITNVDVKDLASIERALEQSRANVIINAVGIVKQSAGAQDPVLTIKVNALFPQELAGLARSAGIRLLHISTDCVFSGRKGNYSEADIPDPVDLYGRSKLLGELSASGALTLRTSIVGRELRGGLGLFEWFLGQAGKRVSGYSRAVFSGLTTGALATLIGDILEHHQELDGLWHVSAEPIDKLRLLQMLRDVLDVSVEIEPDESLVIDRSLDSSSLRNVLGWAPPSWETMLAGMAEDPTPYRTLQERQC